MGLHHERRKFCGRCSGRWGEFTSSYYLHSLQNSSLSSPFHYRQITKKLNRVLNSINGEQNSQYLRLVVDLDQMRANKKAIPINGRRVLIKPTRNKTPNPAEL